MNDEFAGMGGSYTIDPKTGARKLIERTEEIILVPEPAQSTPGKETE